MVKYDFPLHFVLLLFLFGMDCYVAAAPLVSASVNPASGDDLTCNSTSPCKTIAYAVHQLGASVVNLSAGVFNESVVSIGNISTLIISGIPEATIFDCSRRLVASKAGAAFMILNSSVTITGVTFSNCNNEAANGGAISAAGSSVVISECRFLNCSAASGGAVSVSGPGSSLAVTIQNSTFEGNSAIGSCPSDADRPCSTWGGAIAVLDIPSITVIRCKMANNRAVTYVPSASPQASASSNAVAGGGCMSVLFSGNASGCSVRAFQNTFDRCMVSVASSNGVRVGNGAMCIHH